MAAMEHHQTQRQRLQTFERLQRLKRSTRPERILPLFSFEDHEDAVKRCGEVDEQLQQQRIKIARENGLRVEEEGIITRARAKTERDDESNSKSKAKKARLGDGHGDNEKEEKGYVGGDADDENDQVECFLNQPHTPDRPIGRRKVDSGLGLGSGHELGITPDKCNSKKAPSTAERTPYAESDDGLSTGSSYATAATTPEDNEGQEHANRNACARVNSIGGNLETPTRQDRKITARLRPENTIYKPIKQASTQAYVPPIRPKRGDFATTRAIDEPIEDWYFLVRECLQCEIAGVKCGRQIPACKQCQRRFDGNMRGYRASNSSGKNGGGTYGFGEWSRPDGICSAGGRGAGSQCLVQRRWHARELVNVHALPDKREAMLIRLESDSDAVWEGKLREAARVSRIPDPEYYPSFC